MTHRYMDNAATSFAKPPCVTEAIVNALCSHGNPLRGAHGFSLEASRAVLAARKNIARLFNAKAERTSFTSGVTESLNIAIGSLKPGAHVITTAYEHNSVLRPLYRLGAALTVLSPRGGCIRAERFAGAVTRDTRAIVCTHASNVTGELNDIRAIGALCRERRILFIVDAAQTAGVFDIDVERDNIDVLCFTGHKALFGPQGTGGLCVREGLSLAPLKVGGGGVNSFSKMQSMSMPESLEAGTLNSHGIAGLSAGVGFVLETGTEAIRAHEKKLTHMLIEGAKRLKKLKLYGNLEAERAPVVALNIEGADPAVVADVLFEEYAIAVRAGAHCAPLMHEYLGTGEGGAVRFSLSYFNTEADVEYALFALKELVERA